MRLITGPAGSGKSTWVLDEFREALRRGDPAIRLLVPTATLAQHIQNQLAREGLVYNHNLVQTLHDFADLADKPEIPDAVFYLLVQDAARRVSRPEFARVAHLPGFSAALAKCISEFAEAGCDSARLARSLPDAPLADAFLAIYREVDLELARRSLFLRAHRLTIAADRVDSAGLPDIRTIWIDGFHSLPDPELRLIAALGRRANLTLTLSDSDLAAPLRRRLLDAGFIEHRATRGPRGPAEILVPVRNIERECEEIARRIAEQAASGLAFREIGIIVRAESAYVPTLRATLSRFGIPAHFYFEQRLDEHPVVRYLCGAVDAMLAGWDHERTLAVLRLAPRFADLNALDRLDFDARAQIPAAGLAELRSLLIGLEGHPAHGAEPIVHKLDSLAILEEWRRYSNTPRVWADRSRDLRHIFRAAADPLPTGPLRHESALLLRAQARVLNLLDEAFDEAAQSLPPDREIPLEAWWPAVQSVLRLKPLRVSDDRRNVVRVLPAHEARQWVLKVVFVCGLTERQFPQLHSQDLFFPDPARHALNRAGIRIRTTADFEREERALFDSAMGRATQLTVITYPECDARGERTLLSLYLDGRLTLRTERSRPAAPQARSERTPHPAVEIRALGLLPKLAETSSKLPATSLERYLQCPFEFFGNRTLKFRPVPSWPEERLNFLIMGNIVHDVLKEWWPQRPANVAPIFDRVFEEYRDKNRIPRGYHTERIRNEMLSDLQMFAADDQWPGGFTSKVEENFTLQLPTPDGETIEIPGRIDRLDISPSGESYILDYKYSANKNVRKKLKNQRLLQAQLYGMAAEQVLGTPPTGMFYVGVKKKVDYVGWSQDQFLGGEPFPERWFEEAQQSTLNIIGRIRSGTIAPDPADLKHCKWCDFRDACRVESARAFLLEKADAEAAASGDEDAE